MDSAIRNVGATKERATEYRTMSSLFGVLAMILVANAGQPAGASIELRDEEDGTLIWSTALCHPLVERAELVSGGYDGLPAIDLSFRDDLAERFGAVTSENIGRTLTILIDGEILAEPRIMEPILTGNVQLSPSEPDRLARVREAALEPCDR